MRSFLAGDGGLLVDPAARDQLRNSVTGLEEKTLRSDEPLYVGILGGTGVGKSTLIDALACKEISTRSDKRPFTDRAVVYRHQETQRGLDDLTHLFRSPDAVHHADAIRDLVLLDLPDFDSREPENRRTVLQILPAMDCIVWVASPEKYADSAFYDFVRHTVMSQANFTFVLNKCDELVADSDATLHYDTLKEVLGDLAFRLTHDAGVEQPRIFPVSAATQLDGRPCDALLVKEFQRFRDLLMVRREAKEIQAIKTANLDEEVRSIVKELNSLVRPEEKAAAIRAMGEVHLELPVEVRTLAEHSQPEARKLAYAIFAALLREDASLRPVRLAMRLLGLARRHGTTGDSDSLPDVFRAAAVRLGGEPRAKLEAAAHRVDSELLLAFRSGPSFGDPKTPDQLLAHAGHRAAAVFIEAVERRKETLSGPRSRWRRLIQKLVLTIPVPFFLVKVAGPAAVQSCLTSPSLGAALGIVLGFFTSLFGPEGLVALLALLIFEAVLTGYLASTRLRRIERYGQQLALYAIELLASGTRAVFRQLETDRREAVQRVGKALEDLAALNRGLER